MSLVEPARSRLADPLLAKAGSTTHDDVDKGPDDRPGGRQNAQGRSGGTNREAQC